ncbi:MAG TPA: 3-methyl-2-oxobutanoate dehydrogenase subunit VorB [Ignavibacteriales bacterium]|nr:3-methyl-2-oxobutanoate dehydrogenase subunit VorB [Ignavibacteriales bacterium]HOL80290.1 3-methyl-2-oxobutanoate dehydrogenase subunit VorB [Ignavibacteriales bacterium]HOM64569.1 3-methyl-2-oxobutanoate dehydrogenase subunit VorB [Ignavibacteriales bacterium]HPD66666.1 3-methyl-2-oxobutanoate dehydrogenase subunit VorB [Ignavibacteriales bacterium]HPP32479.1 3-methyl-2-oxobutanoate dehydrogenase subunit VorB [Ignavibacteriales bacterium]
MKELKLMKGNEAIAEAAIRAGCDAYFGYPITPQSEILEYLAANAQKRTGMVVLQAESEIASINMVYGAAGCGKRVMTSSSSPGISLMQEGISYIACAELPCLLVNVMRGGPGLGTIQPSQGDYFQTVKGGGHGDYRLITLAPSTIQEAVDFTKLAFDLAFKWRNPVMLLLDGAIGQMMEKVELFSQQERLKEAPDWATVGKPKNRERNIITSLHMQPEDMEKTNQHLQAKYRKIEEEETRFECYKCDDADYIFTGFGLVARIAKKAADIARTKGYKIGVFRPITLFPFPYSEINNLSKKVKAILDVEMNTGQMLEDVKLAVNGNIPVEFHGRTGGMIPTPEEIVAVFEEKIIKRK